MTLGQIAKRVMLLTKANMPEILTGVAIGGVVTTTYLTAKASFKAKETILESEAKGGVADTKKQRIKENAKLVWTFYIPPAVTGALTIGCIVGSGRASGQRTAAAVTAYSLTEKAFSEYRGKVVEQIGKNKEQAIRDSVAEDRVSNDPVGKREVIILGKGEVLCCELHTGRYFRSNMETLRKVQNKIGWEIVNQPYVTLDDFYELLGLPGNAQSHRMGWDSDKMMELEFTSVLAEGGEPCLAFGYNYLKPLK